MTDTKNIDATKLHGLVNSGDVPMRYIVIIAREG